MKTATIALTLILIVFTGCTQTTPLAPVASSATAPATKGCWARAVRSGEMTRAVRDATSKPLIVKLSPNVTDIADIASAVEAEGADAVSLINTLLGMAIDVRTFRPKLARVVGGLSGPAIRPIAVRMVWQVARAVSIPVVGMGGIMCAEDAVEFMLAGATAVAVGTANFVDPAATARIVEGLEHFCAERGIGAVTELIGAVEL